MLLRKMMHSGTVIFPVIVRENLFCSAHFTLFIYPASKAASLSTGNYTQTPFVRLAVD